MSIHFFKSIYFEFLSYFVPQKINYKIVGHCLQCGNCCKNIRCYGLKNEFEFKIMQFLIPAYKSFFIVSKDEYNNFILSCKHLTIDNKCSRYATRHFVCKSYPKQFINKNLEMLDGCGYKIIKKSFKDFL